jgi:hypothetical protein
VGKNLLRAFLGPGCSGIHSAEAKEKILLQSR